MKTGTQQIRDDVDEFWTEHLALFSAHFSTPYTKPQKVWGRFHAKEETYFDTASEIIPIKQRNGMRTYVMMQPYVLEPQLTLTVGLYNKPKHYADQDSALGETIGKPKHNGFREAQVGNTQAWYYHADKTIVLWECFLDRSFRSHPLALDPNMVNLWKAFEHWLTNRFPEAATIATPFNDPVAHSIEEYQLFLRYLDYTPIAKAAFGRKL